MATNQKGDVLDDKFLIEVTLDARPGLRLAAEIELPSDRRSLTTAVATHRYMAQWALDQAGALYDSMIGLIRAGHFDVVRTLQAKTERLACEIARQAEAGSAAPVIAPRGIQMAAFEGDIEQMEQLLHEGTDVDEVNCVGMTALLAAAGTGSIPAVNFLLCNGANVSKSSSDGVSPLHLAAREGRNQVIEILLAHKADINATGACGDTPLHHAALSGQLATAELLIANGADVNAVANDGRTPVAIAERNGHNEVADMLRKRGGAA